MAGRVFISHSEKDRPVAMAICDALEVQGIRCWIAPRDVQGGGFWKDEVVEAIERCRVMVLVFSSRSTRSRMVRRELSVAADGDIPLLPVRIEDVQPTGAFKFDLADVHWIDAFPQPIQSHLGRIVEDVRRLLTDRPKREGLDDDEPATLPRRSKARPSSLDLAQTRVWDRLCLDIHLAVGAFRLFVFTRIPVQFGRASRAVQAGSRDYVACDVVLRFGERLPADRASCQALQALISRNALTVVGGPETRPAFQRIRDGNRIDLPDDVVVAADASHRIRLRLRPLAAEGGRADAWEGAWVVREGDLESHSYLALFGQVAVGGGGAAVPLLGCGPGEGIRLTVHHHQIFVEATGSDCWTVSGMTLKPGNFRPLSPGDELRSRLGRVVVRAADPERFVEAVESGVGA